MKTAQYLAALFLISAAAWCQTAPQFIISTAAGSEISGFGGDNGPAAGAQLSNPFGVALDAAGNLYIADTGNNRVRKVTPGGIITTFAGNGQSQTSGDGGPATAAGMTPFNVTADGAGNVYIADQTGVIRKVDTRGMIMTVAGKAGFGGYSGDGGPAVDALLSQPDGLVVDASGNLYIADTNNDIIRKIDTRGIITTVAGKPQTRGYSGDNGPAASAMLDNPTALALDESGNLYIADQNNCLIRKIDTKGTITTVAGLPPASAHGPNAGYSGDGGPATRAALNLPSGAAVDASGNVYIADSQNNVIRMIRPDGTITTIAGDRDGNYSGDGGPALQASLNQPWGLAAASSGNIYIADRLNGRVRVLAPAPAVSLVAGSGLSAPLETTLSANGLFTVFGSNLAPPGTALQPGAAHGALPLYAAGICVQIGATLAPLTYISPTQINAQVPALGASGSVPVSVITHCGAANALTSAPVSAPLAAATPEFLYFVHNANGQNPVAAIDNATGAFIGAAGLISGATFTPAKAGEVVTIFGVGFGQTNPPQTPGILATAAAKVSNATVTLGGSPIAPLYIGVSPTYAGLYQVSLTVPAGLKAGPQPIQVTIAGAASPAGAYLEIGQ